MHGTLSGKYITTSPRFGRNEADGAGVEECGMKNGNDDGKDDDGGDDIRGGCGGGGSDGGAGCGGGGSDGGRALLVRTQLTCFKRSLSTGVLRSDEKDEKLKCVDSHASPKRRSALSSAGTASLGRSALSSAGTASLGRSALSSAGTASLGRSALSSAGAAPQLKERSERLNSDTSLGERTPS